MKNYFITFEGGEGSGKSTQIDFLNNFLNKKGANVLCTREPGGTPSAEIIRDLILKDIKPSRSYKDDKEGDGKETSALDSLGLKPKPAI